MEFDKRPTYATINLNHLRFNAKQLMARLKPKQEIMAIVKANAYGHGASFVARTLAGCGIKKFGVATFAEGLELREQGIKNEIFVLNGLMGPLEEYFRNRLYPVLHNMEQLRELSSHLNQENREFCACLKFDTGMNRLGFAPAQVDEILSEIKYLSALKIVGVLSHLANADEADHEMTARQLTLFGKLRAIIEDRGLKGSHYSIGNSAALLDGRFEDFDWVRPGIALYGCYAHERQKTLIDLKPVLELKTRLFAIKKVMPHSSVGYGGTFVTQRESVIGILPVGYADGYPRHLSNQGQVLIKGRRAPVAGRVSMDLMAVDLTDIPEAQLYDEVTLIGQDGNEAIKTEEVAGWAGTVCYEILCGLSPRVHRIYEGL